ncbi:MAG TPA: hypothetical protein VIZ17_12635 [Acetobacteraceae bacterium]
MVRASGNPSPRSPDEPRRPEPGARSSFRHVPLFLALGLTLAGCKLIDQTTFAPSPSQNPAILPTAPRFDRRAALLSIDEGTPISSYRDLLRFAVQQARSRDPRVQFDVTIAIPGGTDAAAQTKAIAAGQPDAATVMQQIAQDGVSATDIQLRAGVDDAITRPQIRVYVR